MQLTEDRAVIYYTPALPCPRDRSCRAIAAAIGLTAGLLLSACGKVGDAAPAAPPAVPPPAAAPVAAASATPAATAELPPASVASAGLEPASKAAAPVKARAGEPADVAAFRDKRDQCDQLRGEDPGDRQGKAREELLAKQTRYCAGSDAALRALRRKYTNDLKVLDDLKDYDDKIE